MKKRKIIIYSLLFILLISSFILRLWPLQISHWWDECVYLQHSEIIFSGRNNYNEFILRPPLLPIILALGYFFKHSIFTADIIVPLLGTIGILFTFLVGKELYNEEVGLLAGIFFGFSPFMIEASHWIMTGIPALTFIIISFYLSILSIKKDSSYLIFLSGIFFGMSILTRFTSLILILIIPIFLYINHTLKRKLYFFAYGLILTLSPYLIWAQIRYHFFLRPFIFARNMVSDKMGGLFFYLKNFTSLYPWIIIMGILIYIIYLALFLKQNALKSFGKYSNFNSKKIKKQLLKYDLVFVFWILSFLIYISTIPHKEMRYIIPLALPVYLLSSRGFYFLFNPENKKQKIIILLFISLLLLFSFFGSFSRLHSPFIETYESAPVRVSNYINSLKVKPRIIYVNQEYPVYAYYTGIKIIVPRQDKSFYSVFPKSMPFKGILIYYKDVKKEPNYKWLESNKQFTKLKEIGDIILYEYIPNNISLTFLYK